jgi:hypothetical protein
MRRDPPAVEILLTGEQIAAIPDWEEQYARFQFWCETVAGDIRLKFRQCLHEGGHAMYNRRYGRDVRFHGPRAEYDDGPRFTFGSVEPIINDDNWWLTDWEYAAISMAAFTVVERITGLPEVREVINTDLQILLKNWRTRPVSLACRKIVPNG